MQPSQVVLSRSSVWNTTIIFIVFGDCRFQPAICIGMCFSGSPGQLVWTIPWNRRSVDPLC